ncbi:MAG: Mut7-C RNAse domain-containing protein [Actinobacteria bacterium]|nr:Mut7-C RNAse domain-containing protein [Actinomycetota bacterium]
MKQCNQQSSFENETKKPKFIADMMLGRLARYLRIFGYDVLYFQKISDGDLVNKAESESRIVLTRDSSMIRRSPFKYGRVKFLFIRDDKVLKQLKQWVKELNLELKINLIRCIECNHILEKVDRENAKGKVPVYTYKSTENFAYCSNCDKYYWKGTHLKLMNKRFSFLLKEKDN